MTSSQSFEGQEKLQNGEIAKTVWFLVEHEVHLPDYLNYAKRLEKDFGIQVRVVNAPEVFGVLTKDAIVGNAERFVHSLKTAIGLTSEEFEAAVRQESPNLLFVCGKTFLRPLTLLKQVAAGSMAIVPIIETLDPSASVVLRHSKNTFSGDVQGWIVPSETSAAILQQLGAEKGRLVVGGLPFPQIGFPTQERHDLRQKWGFEGQRVVLIRASVFPQRALEPLMFQLSLVSEELKLIFHHDGNRRLADTLKRLAEKKGMHAQMFGKVEQLRPYIAASDLVVTTASDQLALTSVTVRTPLLLCEIERDARNDYSSYDERDPFSSNLVTSGAATAVSLGSQIPKVLLDQDLLAQQKAAQESLIQPDTSEKLYAAMTKVISCAPQWLRDDEQNSPLEPTSEDDDDHLSSPGTSLSHPDDADNVFQKIGRTVTHHENEDPLEAMRRQFASSDTHSNNLNSHVNNTNHNSNENDSPSKNSHSIFGRFRRSQLTEKEAKAILTELILEQRRLETEFEKSQMIQEKWYRRLNLARSQPGNDDLEHSAQTELEKAKQHSKQLEDDLLRIEQRKESIKSGFQGGKNKDDSTDDVRHNDSKQNVNSSLEDRFRMMEEDARLDDFKRKLDDTNED